MDLYLTEAELERRTGRRYAKVQKRVLKAMGIPFDEDADGKPLVLRSVVERDSAPLQVAPPRPGPDPGALAAIMGSR